MAELLLDADVLLALLLVVEALAARGPGPEPLAGEGTQRAPVHHLALPQPHSSVPTLDIVRFLSTHGLKLIPFSSHL